jgi:uncharacterized membrane protein YeaQ/YmgE (transglycosylase-associated protein family)
MAKNIKARGAIMTVAGGVAGGFVGDQFTTMIEKALVKGGNINASRIAPIASALIGTAVIMFANDKVKSVGIGMVAVSGTEAITNIIARANSKSPSPETQPPLTQSANVRITPNANSASTRVYASNRGVNGYYRYKG